MADESKRGELDAQEVLVRQDFGLNEDNKRVVRDNLTPIDRITPDLVTAGRAYSFLGRDEEISPLTRGQVDLAITAVDVYREMQKEIRERAQARDAEFQKEFGNSTGSEYLHYGETTNLIDYVTVLPEGPGGRYLVSFLTTHVWGSDNRETLSSGFFFDEKVRGIDHGYPARNDSSWLVGKKEGKNQLVGRYGELHEEAEGLVGEMLQHRGFTDIAEIMPMGIDSHAGWLKDSPSSSLSK